jgi:hypothetical protein
MFPPATATPIDGRELSLDDLVAQARDLATQISQLQARQVALVAEIDRRAGRFDGTTSAFVGWQCGLQPGESRRTVALARKLPSLPRLSRSFAAGELSEATVRLLTTVATPENEAKLLETAQVATGAQLRTLVARLRPQVDGTDPDGRPRPDAGRPSDFAVGWRDQRLATNGDFIADDGLDLEQALRLAREQLRADHDADRPSAAALPDERARLTDAEALMRIARAFLAANTTEAGLVPEGHHTVIVSSDAELTAHVTGEPSPGDPSYAPGASAVPPWLAAARACHGSVSALVVHHGEPVLGSIESRFATAAQKRALLVSDGCCAFPGCGVTLALIAHHIVEYDDGGSTELGNLVLLCRQHHNLVHRKRYRIEVGGERRFTFFRADGTCVPGARTRPPPSGTDPPPPGRRFTGSGERLTWFGANAILHHWLGGRSPVHPRGGEHEEDDEAA